MLETTYVLVIDTKNLLDTVDEVRIHQTADVSGKSVDSLPLGQSDTDDCQTDTVVESQSSNKEDDSHSLKLKSINNSNRKDSAETEQIYANGGVHGK